MAAQTIVAPSRNSRIVALRRSFRVKPRGKRHPSTWPTPFKVIASCGLAWVHLYLTALVASTTRQEGSLIVMVFAPALLATAVFPASRRKFWRWIVLGMLALSAVNQAGAIIMLVGGTWLWFQCWFVDQHSADQKKLDDYEAAVAAENRRSRRKPQSHRGDARRRRPSGKS